MTASGHNQCWSCRAGGGGGWRGETYTPHYHNYTPRHTTADYHTDEHVYYSWSTLIINVLLCIRGQRKSNRWCQHHHHTEPHPDQFTLGCYSTPDKMQGTWKIHCPRRWRTSNRWANTTTQIHIQINSPCTTKDKMQRTWKIHCPSRGSFEEW